MRKTIAFFTTTRAEFGILSAFINRVAADDTLSYLLFVGGTHLKKEFGHTIDEILNSGLSVAGTFDYLEETDSTPYNLTRASGRCMNELAEIFVANKFDFICVLGDRYELIPIVLTSVLFDIPIIHFGGGETTEGAIDNKIRHMVSLASQIHFTAADFYSDFLVNMGVPQESIFTVGSLAVESMRNIPAIPKEELFRDLNLHSRKETVLLTYHPVTVRGAFTQQQQIQNIFEALKEYKFQIVVTAPNLETERDVIINYLNEQVNNNENISLYDSLGMKRYHSMISYCSFVIGNSSSGIFEVPYYRKPTINIGDRQKGRYLHPSVIQVDNSVAAIKSGIDKARSKEFLEQIGSMIYQFGNGNSSAIALEVLKEKIK